MLPFSYTVFIRGGKTSGMTRISFNSNILYYVSATCSILAINGLNALIDVLYVFVLLRTAASKLILLIGFNDYAITRLQSMFWLSSAYVTFSWSFFLGNTTNALYSAALSG